MASEEEGNGDDARVPQRQRQAAGPARGGSPQREETGVGRGAGGRARKTGVRTRAGVSGPKRPELGADLVRQMGGWWGGPAGRRAVLVSGFKGLGSKDQQVRAVFAQADFGNSSLSRLCPIQVSISGNCTRRDCGKGWGSGIGKGEEAGTRKASFLVRVQACAK